MKILKREKKDFVRIIIGYTKTGYSGIRKPIRSISVQEATVDQVYDKIKEILKKEDDTKN